MNTLHAMIASHSILEGRGTPAEESLANSELLIGGCDLYVDSSVAGETTSI